MKDIHSTSLPDKITLINSDPDPFDWYQRFSGVKDSITPHFTTESVILNVGCGNSSKLKMSLILNIIPCLL